MTQKETGWITEGYHCFSVEGPKGLKVERLAKSVGKNKSSFYHLFADLTLFESRLLDYHVQQSRIIASKEAEATTGEELIAILLDHKTDLLFNRQLRFHREEDSYHRVLTEIDAFALPALLPLWQSIIRLPQNADLAHLVLLLTLENFFLQITDSTLNTTWLRNYFHQIRSLVNSFQSLGRTSVNERVNQGG